MRVSFLLSIVAMFFLRPVQPRVPPFLDLCLKAAHRNDGRRKSVRAMDLRRSGSRMAVGVVRSSVRP